MTSRALLYCAGGGIGDSLVASVVARALRSRFSIVDALTLPGHRSTLERVPDIDEVLVDEGDERDVARMLRSRGYEACIVTWATPRTARIPLLAKIPVRVGQARRLYSSRFTNSIVVRSELGDVTSSWSDILLDFARAIGCDTDDRFPRFVPTSADIKEAGNRAKGCRSPIHHSPSVQRDRVATRHLADRRLVADSHSRCTIDSTYRYCSAVPKKTSQSTNRSSPVRTSSTSPGVSESARSVRWHKPCARSSASRPGRCTSLQPSAHRPSASSRSNATFRTVGARSVRARKRCARRIRVTR